MPTIEHFLDIFEAVSRKDWDDVSKIADCVAEYERTKKHYVAAAKIKDAAAIALSRLASPTGLVTSSVSTTAPPIDLLTTFDNQAIAPSIPVWLDKELKFFCDEWNNIEKLRGKNLNPRKTILLHGPPGCGKTMLAHYIAKLLNLKIYTVRFDSLISSYLGETGSNIRKIFEFANSNRCVLFIDEIDAVAKLRDDNSELGELKRVVITLLQNIDLFSSESILIAATNHAHMLDEAIWRRFEIVWEMLPPKDEVRLSLLNENFNDLIKSEDNHSDILDVTKGLSGADLIRIVNESKRKILLEGDLEPFESFLLAMLEYCRRGERNSSGRSSDKVSLVVSKLKKIYGKKYSFAKLEEVTGIPHSTLHHKMKNKNG